MRKRPGVLTNTPKLALFLILAACAGRGVPPIESPPAQLVLSNRDSAVALLRGALAALGATNREATRTFVIRLESRQVRGNENQARIASDTIPYPVPTGLQYWHDVTGRRAVHELDSPAPGDIWFRYRTVYDTLGGWQIDRLKWRLGTDVQRANAAQARAFLALADRLVPHVAIGRALASSSASMKLLPATTRARRAVLPVSYTDPGSSQLTTVEIDAETLLPAAFIVGTATTELTEYRRVNGVRVPYRRRQVNAGVPFSDMRVAEIQLNAPLTETLFVIPAGYSAPPLDTAARATRIAENVYRLDGMPSGYHAMFVVGDAGVFVVEAPQTPAYSEVALRVIAGVAPGKPVSHVFVTHHHSDHVGGLAPYVSRGATVVVGAGLEAAIRRQLPDSLRSRVQFETVATRRAFGAGTSSIVALPIPNTHADGNTAYYLPTQRVLFQGDLFYIPERGPVPVAFPVTNALEAAVRQAGLQVDIVVGVHGRSGTWADVLQSIALAR
jgi:glyoxylase-like metal-dependent hydrolase (beta-lactamase superfamily II)